MDDARSKFAEGYGEFGVVGFGVVFFVFIFVGFDSSEVEGEGVCDCAAGVASCGVDEYIGGLIDDDYVVVFVEDIERYIFRRDFRFWQFGQGDFDEVVGIEF